MMDVTASCFNPKNRCLHKTPDLITWLLFQTVRQKMSNKSDQSLHTNHLHTCQSPSFLKKIILTFIGSQNDSVTISHDRQNAQLDERQRHFFPIDFHPHFLQQRDFGSILEPDSDGSRPTKVQRVSGIIGDPHWVARALAQQVFATALKIKDFPIKSLVMGVAKNRTNALLIITFWTTLAFFLHQNAIGATFDGTLNRLTIDMPIAQATTFVTSCFPGLPLAVLLAFVATAIGPLGGQSLGFGANGTTLPRHQPLSIHWALSQTSLSLTFNGWIDALAHSTGIHGEFFPT